MKYLKAPGMATRTVTGATCFQGHEMHFYAKQSRQTGHPLKCTLTYTQKSLVIF